MKEICNECGLPVDTKSGRFVNRVIDFNDYLTRKEMGKPFPEGDYICAECELLARDIERNMRHAKVLPFKRRQS